MGDTEGVSRQFIPVVLGDKQGVRVARQLYWQHGISSHLLCPRLSLWRRLTPWLLCHELPSSPALTVLALRDLAAEIEDKDRTPLLMVCDDVPVLDQALLDELENFYIMCRDGDTPPLQYDQGGRA